MPTNFRQVVPLPAGLPAAPPPIRQLAALPKAYGESDATAKSSTSQPDLTQSPTIRMEVSETLWDTPKKVVIDLALLDEADNFGMTGNSSEFEKGSWDHLYVRGNWTGTSTFYSTRTGMPDHSVEQLYGRLKYKNFMHYFMRMSFVMPIGVWAQAAYAGIVEESDLHMVRSGILAGLVAPVYLVYFLFAFKFTVWYKKLHGTLMEKIFVGLLCLQSLGIVAAESMREELDYGLLIMHIAFVHNFSPFNECAIQVASALCGLFPYIVVKAYRIFYLDDDLAAPSCGFRSMKLMRSLEILMPTVILMAQTASSYNRSKCMRMDLLYSEKLQFHKRNTDAERDATDGMLRSMLPKEIITALHLIAPVEPQQFNETTVIFIQICNFECLCTNFVEQPHCVVRLLNDMFSEFDALSDMLDVYKVETVMDVYMAVVGCPQPVSNHADLAAHFALAIQERMPALRMKMLNAESIRASPSPTLRVELGGDKSLISLQEEIETAPALFQAHLGSNAGRTLAELIEDDMINVRIGLNSGKLRAGVVGMECPRYKLVGDTVNTASRMESTCQPGRVQVSANTMSRLTPGLFELEARGEIEVKGKGMMSTAFLNGFEDGRSVSGREFEIQRVRILDSDDSSDHQTAPRSAESDASALTIHHECSGMSSKYSAEREDSKPSTLVKVRSDTSREWWSNPAAGSTRASDTTRRLRNELSRFGDIDHILAGERPRRQHTVDWAAAVPTTILQKLEAAVLPMNLGWKSLQQDHSKFLEVTLEKRIISARWLTIIWLLILTIVFAGDMTIDASLSRQPGFRAAALSRSIGITFAGLVYVLLTFLSFFQRYASLLTSAMLAFQGGALLANAHLVYNGDPAIVALYGSYVLFYKVCTIPQRLGLCLAVMFAYCLLELQSCPSTFAEKVFRNFAFLFLFFSLTAIGVRLEERIEETAHWEVMKVSARLEELQEAKSTSTSIIETLLPRHVVEMVSSGVSPIAEYFDGVTVMFTDIKGFTAMSAKMQPQEVIDLLNTMYSMFDEIVINWQVYKVEVIGDAYFLSAGCPARPEVADQPDMWAMRAVEVALAMQRALSRVADEDRLTMRVGLHTGPVVAGVVGKKGPRYHLFGSTVGYAEKMESSGVPGRVQISNATHTLLKDGGHDYEFEETHVSLDGGSLPHTTWLVKRSRSKVALMVQKELIMQRRVSNNPRQQQQPFSPQASIATPRTTKS